MIRIFSSIVIILVGVVLPGCSKDELPAKRVQPHNFGIIAWNVESDGSDPAVIARQLDETAEASYFNIVALSEVLPTEFERFARGWPEIHSESGGSDRLMICWDPKMFELVRRLELDHINDGRHRSPLVAHLRNIVYGEELLVVNNHLARGDAAVRLMQAEKLVEWAREQTLPIIAVGDYNFDYEFTSQNGNDAFKAFMRDGVWKWLKPRDLHDTNWADHDGDGVDDYPNSMLDFAFVAGPAKDWVAISKVLGELVDFPDDETTSDHRMIFVGVQVGR